MTDKMNKYRKTAVVCRLMADISRLAIIILILWKFNCDFGYGFNLWQYRSEISMTDRRKES